MKKIFSIFLLVIMAFAISPVGMASHPAIEEFVKAMNDQAAGTGMTATYDGSNIIMVMNQLGDDERAMFGMMDQSMLDQMAPMLANEMSKGMGSEAAVAIDLLSSTNTNIVIKIPTPSGEKHLTITPAMLKSGK